MRNFFVHLSFLTAFSLSIATQARSAAVEPNPLSYPQEACSLPAPNNFQCTGTTSTSASFVWDNVPGASSYTLKTYISSTFTLVNTTLVPGDVSTIDIPNLDQGVNYVTHISSTCDNGQQGESYSSASFIVFILELVVSGFTIPGEGSYGCQLEAPLGNACSFPWDGNSAKFRVSKIGSSTNFTVKKTINGNGFEVVQMTADIISTPNFSFQGIKLSTPQTCEINTSCSILSKIRVYSLEGSTLVLVTELFFANTNTGGGKIWASGGIRAGYSIQNIREIGGGNKPQPSHKIFEVNTRENTSDSSAPIELVAVNPFTDQIQITLQSSSEAPISLQLFDLQGRALQQNEYPAGSEQYTMQTTDVPPGLYVLRVKIGSQTSHLKLVKAQ